MVIIIALITSLIGSFLISRLYLNMQYHHSNAGHRQEQIILATRDIFAKPKLYSSVQHRYSLGKVIEILYNCYSVENRTITGVEVLPNFNEDGINGWVFFEHHVRPVSIDLNNNSFIGWITWVPNVKRLRTVWELCFNIEKLIKETQRLKNLHANTNNSEYTEFYKANLYTIKKEHLDDPNLELSELMRLHIAIKTLWTEWILLNNLNNR